MAPPITALITGVGGQDGGYLAERLLADGVEVHALALPGDPPVAGVHTHHGDVADVTGTRALLLDLAPHEIYNLAAVSSVARSWEEPDLVARVNGLAAVGLLESAYQLQERTGRAVRFVQASSAEIFGQPDRSPQDESTPVRPVNPYGAAKAYAHLMVGVYRQRGLPATALILYNHESPRRPIQFVTRKITAGVAAIAAGTETTLRLGNL
ncbi:MAG TPA: GDP-mannose 4,6-dehydratase, partial [Nocardioides sp.]|nr:GDP-mannose 4,6-dehydratase [Nocardioides sp.]